MVKELETYWPCGCYTYREGTIFYIRPCSPNCKILRTVIELSKEHGNEIIYPKVGG